MSKTTNTDKRNNTRKNKREVVLGTKKRKRHLPMIAISSVLFLCLCGAVAYIGIVDPGSETANANISASKATTSSEVAFPISLFDDGKAHHFDFKAGDITVRYFILKSADGVIRCAFDACDVCWPAGKGYFQEGEMMVCRNCGRRFDSVRINEVKGGCNPAPLNRSIVNDQLVLRMDDILKGKSYFDFSNKG